MIGNHNYLHSYGVIWLKRICNKNFKRLAHVDSNYAAKVWSFAMAIRPIYSYTPFKRKKQVTTLFKRKLPIIYFHKNIYEKNKTEENIAGGLFRGISLGNEKSPGWGMKKARNWIRHGVSPLESACRNSNGPIKKVRQANLNAGIQFWIQFQNRT